jgi:hypothetical protein
MFLGLLRYLIAITLFAWSIEAFGTAITTGGNVALNAGTNWVGGVAPVNNQGIVLGGNHTINYNVASRVITYLDVASTTPGQQTVTNSFTLGSISSSTGGSNNANIAFGAAGQTLTLNGGAFPVTGTGQYDRLGAVDFSASGGTVTMSATGTAVNASFLNTANGTLNVTSGTATLAGQSVLDINAINITTTLKVNTTTDLTTKNVTLTGSASTLTLANPSYGDRVVTINNTISTGVVNRGVVAFAPASGNSLTVNGAGNDPTKSLGTAANTLSKVQIIDAGLTTFNVDIYTHAIELTSNSNINVVHNATNLQIGQDAAGGGLQFFTNVDRFEVKGSGTQISRANFNNTSSRLVLSVNNLNLSTAFSSSGGNNGTIEINAANVTFGGGSFSNVGSAVANLEINAGNTLTSNVALRFSNLITIKDNATLILASATALTSTTGDTSGTLGGTSTIQWNGGTSTVTSSIGAANRVTNMIMNGTGTVTFSKAITATNLKFQAGASVALNNSIDITTTDFQNNAGTVTVASGQSFAGNITSTGGQNGTLTFSGASSLTSSQVTGVGITLLKVGAGAFSLNGTTYNAAQIQANGTNTITLADGFILNGGINITGGGSASPLSFSGAATFTGNVGSSNSVGAVTINGNNTKTVSFGGTFRSSTMNFTSTGNVMFNGAATTAIDFQGNNGTVTLADGVSITGAVNSTIASGGNIVANGTSSISGAVGATNAVSSATVNGDSTKTLTFSNTVNLASLLFTNTGKVALNGTSSTITSTDFQNHNGTLTVASGNTFSGASQVTSTGGRNGILVFSGANSINSSQITGPGISILKIGAGLVSLNGTAFGVGEIQANGTNAATIADGVIVGAINSTGGSAIPLMLSGNFTANGSVGAGGAIGAITVNSNKTITFNSTVAGSALNFVGAGNVNFNGNETIATIDFKGVNGTVTMDNVVATGVINSTVASGGNLVWTGTGSVSGAVGSTNPLTSIVINGNNTKTVTFSSTVRSAAFNFNSDGNVNFNNTATITLIDFQNHNGKITVATTRNITGVVDSTGGGAGTLVFSGTSTVSGNVGATNAISSIIANGDSTKTVTFNGTTIKASSLSITAGSSVVLNGATTANIDFNGTAGTVTFASTLVGTIASTGAQAGTAIFSGAANLSPVTNIALLRVGAGLVTMSGVNSVTEIRANGTNALTLSDGFSLTGSINLTGGSAIPLIFSGTAITGNIGAGASVGAITVNGNNSKTVTMGNVTGTSLLFGGATNVTLGTGTITSTDFQGNSGILTVSSLSGSISSTGGQAGTLIYTGSGSLNAGQVTGLGFSKLIVGDAFSLSSGTYNIGEIQSTSTNAITMADGFILNGGFNLTGGGSIVPLIFTGAATVGDVGTTNHIVGIITINGNSTKTVTMSDIVANGLNFSSTGKVVGDSVNIDNVDFQGNAATFTLTSLTGNITSTGGQAGTLIYTGSGSLNAGQVTGLGFSKLIVGDAFSLSSGTYNIGEIQSTSTNAITMANGFTLNGGINTSVGGVAVDLIFTGNATLGNVGTNNSVGTITANGGATKTVTMSDLVANNLNISANSNVVVSNGTIGVVDFLGTGGTFTADSLAANITSTGGQAGTLIYTGGGSLNAGQVTGLGFSKLIVGDAFSLSSGTYNIGEIQSTSTNAITMADGFILNGGFNLTGGHATDLVFQGNSTVTSIGAGSQVGNISLTTTAGTVHATGAVKAVNIDIVRNNSIVIIDGNIESDVTFTGTANSTKAGADITGDIIFNQAGTLELLNNIDHIIDGDVIVNTDDIGIIRANGIDNSHTLRITGDIGAPGFELSLLEAVGGAKLQLEGNQYIKRINLGDSDLILAADKDYDIVFDHTPGGGRLIVSANAELNESSVISTENNRIRSVVFTGDYTLTLNKDVGIYTGSDGIQTDADNHGTLIFTGNDVVDAIVGQNNKLKVL